REEEISCWVPTFGEINRPDEFGVLTFNSEKPEEPVIHYNFENDFVSSGKVQDVSGHDCQALCQVFKEGENWDGRNVAEGINGRGLLLRGESAKQYLTVKFSPDVSLVRDDFTIAFWVKLTASGGVLAGSTTSAPFWLLNLAGEEQGAYPIFMFNSGSGNKTVAFHAREAGKLNDGRWHHLVLVIDRGRMVRIYVDGKLAGIQNIAGHRGSLKNVLTIGGPYWYPNGVVDEFSVFRGSHGQAFVDLLYSGYRRSE
ncbi:MAG TPA: LamG domain-containing protein, partial [bacterium]|nr:LamG domain-containing protein [bacterium]